MNPLLKEQDIPGSTTQSQEEIDWQQELELLRGFAANANHPSASSITNLYHVRSVLGTVRVRFEREKLSKCLAVVIRAQAEVNNILERMEGLKKEPAR